MAILCFQTYVIKKFFNISKKAEISVDLFYQAYGFGLIGRSFFSYKMEIQFISSPLKIIISIIIG